MPKPFYPNSSPDILADDGTSIRVNVVDDSGDSDGQAPNNAEYNVTPPALTDGDPTSLQVDSSGNLKVTNATRQAGEDILNDVQKVENRFSYSYISSATTTVVKTGSGLLHRIVVNGGTTGTIKIYDNTAASGTVIADFDTTNAIQSIELNVAFATGLTIVTSAATKVTAVWR